PKWKGVEMTRATTQTVCRYCGSPLPDEQALDRIHRAEQERMPELLRGAELESAAQIARLKTQLRQTNQEKAAQVAQLVAEAEKQAEKRVARRLALLERAQAQREQQNADLQRRLERQSAYDRGDAHEMDVIGRLQAVFRDDELKRTGRSGD